MLEKSQLKVIKDKDFCANKRKEAELLGRVKDGGFKHPFLHPSKSILFVVYRLSFWLPVVQPV